MTKVLIGNNTPLDLISDLERFPTATHQAAAISAQRLLWSAQRGDVVVLAQEPSAAFRRNVEQVLGLGDGDLTVVVPQLGPAGVGELRPHSLRDEKFVRRLREAGGRNNPERVVPHYFDTFAVEAATVLGLERTPGFAFAAERGPRFLNSKANFRALAAGLGVPRPEGLVTDDPQRAAAFARTMLQDGHRVIVKHDFHMGGLGNEIIQVGNAPGAVGADTVTILTNPAEVENHLERRWPSRAGNPHPTVIIERYLENCIPIYAEYLVDDAAVTMFGQGEMLMSPIQDGLAIPVRGVEPTRLKRFFDDAHALSELVQRAGYRGLLSVDALVPEQGAIVLNEMNVRRSGSTHIHDLASRILAPEQARNSTLLVDVHHTDESLETILGTLRRLGLGYDPANSAGVIVTADVTVRGMFEYCVIASSLMQAREMAARFIAELSEEEK